MEDSQRPIQEEIATSRDGRDITRGYLSELLTPQDTVLSEVGGSLEVYERVLRDDQVKSTFQQRRAAVTSCEWEVLPGGQTTLDKAAADSLRSQLEAVDFDGITDRMLYGIFYGYAVGEALWTTAGKEVVLQGVKVRKQRRFRFDKDGQLRLLTLSKPLGEVLPEQKFWVYSTGMDNDDDPYGIGLGHWLYWPVFFKRHGMKFWLTFLEKYASPTAVGHYPRGALEEDQNKLLAAATAIVHDSAVVLPEGMRLELLEAARAGSATYENLLDRMNAAISKVTLSQTMTTDNGSSLAQAKVHQGVALWVVKSDADLICGSFNRSIARWLTRWNFPGAAIPQVWRRVTPAVDLQAQATRDKTLFDMGFDPSEKQILDTYGGEWKKRTPSVKFGEPAAEGEVPGVVSGRLGDEADPLMERWIERVRRLMNEVSSLEELRDRLLELAPELSPTELGKVLEQALTVAHLAGRAEVQSEVKDGR